MPRVKHVRRNEANPLVYFDVAISGGPTGTVDLGRVVFELYDDIAPKVAICTLKDFVVAHLLAPYLPCDGCYICTCARPQKTFGSFALEKQALVKLPAYRSTSKGLHSTGSSKAL